MGVKGSVFISGILILGSCTNSTIVLKTDEEQTGEFIYTQHCSICHGDDGNLGVSGAKSLSKSTIDVTQIENIIEKGSNGMPPFEGRLSAAETDKVTEHIKSLRK